VLDILIFSSIIYIWYEGGKLRATPSEVDVYAFSSPLWRTQVALKFDFRPADTAAEGAPKRRAPTLGARARRQPLSNVASVLAHQTRMKGGIRANGEESQGREEEGRQEALS
jgi:hypothetical protein